MMSATPWPPVGWYSWSKQNSLCPEKCCISNYTAICCDNQKSERQVEITEFFTSSDHQPTKTWPAVTQIGVILCHVQKTTLHTELWKLQICQNMPPNPHFQGFYLSKHLLEQLGNFFALGLLSTFILCSLSHTGKEENSLSGPCPRIRAGGSLK